MLKKIIIFFFVFFLLQNLFSQNLVPNYSFEDTLSCPSGVNELYNAPPWFRPTIGTGFGSSDYFNSCTSNPAASTPNNLFGFQIPKTGVAYAGFGVYVTDFGGEGREYIETPLLDSLTEKKKYCIEFYVSLSEDPMASTHGGIKEIGAYFSQDSVLNSSWVHIPVIPQVENNSFLTDTFGWTLISGQFIAQGGEKFLTIGNFRSDANTSVMNLDTVPCTNGNFCDIYYYIDDVSVYCCNNANTQIELGSNQTICLGDSIIIGQPQVAGYYYRWSVANGLNNNDTSIAQPTVKPTVTTTYYLFVEDTAKKEYCNNTAIDSITITVVDFSPVADAGNTQTICEGDSIVIGTAAISGYEYTWQPTTDLSDSNTAQPTANPIQNTTYFLTVQDTGNFCPSAKDSIVISVISPPVADAGSNIYFCEGDSAVIGSSAISGYNYSWQPAQYLNNANIAQPTTNNQQLTTIYILTVNDTDNFCQPKTDTVTVFVISSLADAGNLQTICKGESAIIGTNATSGYNYRWKPATGLSDTTVAQPTFSNEQLTTFNYSLIVSDTANLCPPDTDSTSISVIDCDTIKENIAFLPSVFSPNGDGTNDYFRVRGENIAEISFIIYDRWGEKVYEYNGSPLPMGGAGGGLIGWDGTYKGKNLNTGVFVYFLKITFEDGNKTELKGNVTLVR